MRQATGRFCARLIGPGDQRRVRVTGSRLRCVNKSRRRREETAMPQDRNPSAAPSRRWLLKTGAGLAGALAAPGIIGRAGAQGAFDWKRFKGEKIEVSLAKGPRGDLVQKYRKEFEA